ncbi:MAG TPA: TolC family protein [Gemmatimonadales bacterium]|nr:TolC family protein [Gemmatimonadales bacterium]
MITLALRTILLTALVRSAPDTGLQLTLDSCVRIAERNATPIQVDTAQIVLAGEAVLRQYGQFLPIVDVTTGYLREDGNTFLSQSTTVPTSTAFSMAVYHVAASVNLFNGFRDREALDAALKSRDAVTFDLTRARQQVAFDVTQSFLQTILDRQLVDIAQQNVALSVARQDQLTELVRVGRRPPTDLYRQQAQTSADSATVVDATNRQRHDEIALLERLRLSPDRPWQIVAPADDTVPLAGGAAGAGQLAALAERQRPDLAAASANIAAADLQLHQARGATLPRVDLGLDVFGTARVFDREDQGGTDLLPATQRALVDQLFPQSAYSLTLGVTWHAFDRYATRLDIARARYVTELSQLAYTDLQVRITGEVEDALNDYDAAADRLAATRSGLVAADTAFAAVQARYDTGLSNFVDVVSTQSLLTQSRAAHAAAVVRYALAKRVMALVTGVPVEP